VLEQDHRFLKRRMATSLWFRSVEGALGTIAGYEAMNMIRKGQIRWLASITPLSIDKTENERYVWA
jgi:transposase-like protein